MLKGEPLQGPGLSCGHTWPTCRFFEDLYLFICSCAGSLLLGAGFPSWESRACLHRGAQASHCRGFLLQSTGFRHGLQ